MFSDPKMSFFHSIYSKQLIGLILATIIYLFLNIIMNITVTSLADPKRSLIQGISYIIIPFVWYTIVMYNGEPKQAIIHFLSTKKGQTKNNIIIGLIEGNFVYIILILPLFLYGTVLNERLFYWFDYEFNPDLPIWIVYTFISVCSVEITTKSYVMLPLINENKNRIKIFVITIFAWSLGHIVEIVALSEYVGFFYGALVVTLSGIVSILAVFRSENTYGVITGHFLLNIFIMLYLSF